MFTTHINSIQKMALLAICFFLFTRIAEARKSYVDFHVMANEYGKKYKINKDTSIQILFYTNKASMPNDIQLNCIVLLNQDSIESDPEARRKQFYFNQAYPRFCELLTQDNAKYSLGFRKDTKEFRSFTEFTYISKVYTNSKIYLYFDDLLDDDGSRVKLIVDTKNFDWLSFKSN